MAATPQNATAALVSFGGTAIGGQQDFTLTVNGETIDVTSKDSANFMQKLPGRYSWTLSTNGFAYMDDADGSFDVAFKAAFTAVTTKAEVAVSIALPGGSSTVTGQAAVTSWELSAPDNEGMGGSVSLEGTGALTLTEAA